MAEQRDLEKLADEVFSDDWGTFWVPMWRCGPIEAIQIVARIEGAPETEFEVGQVRADVDYVDGEARVRVRDDGALKFWEVVHDE
jgi:hypothetical protein